MAIHHVCGIRARILLQGETTFISFFKKSISLLTSSRLLLTHLSTFCMRQDCSYIQYEYEYSYLQKPAESTHNLPPHCPSSLTIIDHH